MSSTAESIAIVPRLRMMRLPNAVTAAADVLAGGALAGVALGALAPLLIAAPLLYAGGCVLNDLVDSKRDVSLHPERPLPKGEVTEPEAALLASILLGVGLLMTTLAGVGPMLAASGLILLILFYNVQAKSHPLAGPAVMAGCRSFAVVLGMSIALPSSNAVFLFPVAVFLYVFALSRLARREGSEARDSRSAVETFALLLLAAAVLFTAAALHSDFAVFEAAFFIALFLIPVAFGLGKGLNPGESGDVARGVTALILGIPLLEAVIAAGAGGWAMGTAAAICALPILVGRRVFYVT